MNCRWPGEQITSEESCQCPTLRLIADIISTNDVRVLLVYNNPLFVCLFPNPFAVFSLFHLLSPFHLYSFPFLQQYILHIKNSNLCLLHLILSLISLLIAPSFQQFILPVNNLYVLYLTLNMRFTSSAILLALSAAAARVAATPFKFPLPDGFPNPSPVQLAIIQKEAGGTLPNGPLPTILKSAGVTTLQLLALNELFEVAYFTELLSNVTNGVPGYDAKSIAPLDKTYVVNALTAVVNVSSSHRSHRSHRAAVG